MIQINLVPDVKQELLQAQRVRTGVISGAIMVGLAAVAIVVLLSLYVFGVQAARGAISDRDIKNESKTLSDVQDLSKTLTIQNQLAAIPTIYDKTHVDSRLFDLINAINPPTPNDVTISTLKLDSTTNTLSIEGQAVNGYAALDVFKKTILKTNMTFTDSSGSETTPVATDVSLGDTSYGEDADGQKVLRFTMTLTYPDALFARTSTNATIVPLTKQSNATDSYNGVPKSIFSNKAADIGGGQ